MEQCGKKVLIVDDDSSVLQLYRQLLGVQEQQTSSEAVLSDLMALIDEPDDSDDRDAGQCDATMVDQGDAAVDAVRSALQAEDPYQLLFLDMRLPPGMDGKETARRIRQLQPELPIVFVTAFSDHSEQTLKSVLPTAPIYFNYKPFARLELEEAIQTLAL